MIYSLKVFIVFVALACLAHRSICLLGGGGGGGGGQQVSSLSSKHKLWNFHRYSLVLIYYNIDTGKYHESDIDSKYLISIASIYTSAAGTSVNTAIR